MPIREDKTAKVLKEPTALPDLEFLPDNLVSKINDIFDSYFKLGFSKKLQTIDEENIPNFPNEVSSLNSSDLGNVHSKYVAWYNFANDRGKYISVATTVLEKEVQIAYDTAFIKTTGTLDERKSKAKTDTEYLVLSSYKTKLEGMNDIIDRTVATYDRNIASISREISRREHNM